jgi:hypothetical protein
MSKDYSAATGEIALTSNPQVLEKMRRLKFLRKDAKGEYYETTYGGDTSRNGMAAKCLKFYVGHAMRLPLAWVNTMTGKGDDSGDPRMIELEEACPQCKAKGNTSNGICFHCKGMKYIKHGEYKAIFRKISEDDPTNFDDAELPTRKIEDVDAAAALA